MLISADRLFHAAEKCLVAHAHDVLIELIHEAPGDAASLKVWPEIWEPLHRLEVLEARDFLVRMGYLQEPAGAALKRDAEAAPMHRPAHQGRPDAKP